MHTANIIRVKQKSVKFLVRKFKSFAASCIWTRDGMGIHTGLKIPGTRVHVGSTPIASTVDTIEISYQIFFVKRRI